MSAPEIDELRSYLPIDAVIRDGKPQIEWLKLGSEFKEPFFHDTVARVRREKPHLRSILTDLDGLLQMAHTTSSRQPSGMIFHTSRCGSTTVANACRALDHSRVIAEPTVVDKLVSRLFTDATVGSKELLYLTFIRAAIGLLGPSSTDPTSAYVVKFASPTLLQIKLLRRIWRDVPFLILYRHPLEVAVSNLRNLPEWMNTHSNPNAAAAIAGVATDDLEGMSGEEYCARALGRYYWAADSAADETSTMLIEYQQLSLQTIRRILEFFGVNPSISEVGRIEESMGLYSKDPSRAFQPDSADKKSSASSLTIEMVERWAMPAYQQLVGHQNKI